MPNEEKTETVEKPENKDAVIAEAVTKQATPPAEKQAKTETVEAVDLETIQRQLKNKTEEAERLHKKVDKFEAEEAERQKAAMSETERLQAERDEALKEAARLKTAQTQRDIADEIGLPALFADRIKGETLDEMRADAQKLLDAIPKSKQGQVGSFAPGEAKTPDTTREERLKFLYGSQS